MINTFLEHLSCSLAASPVLFLLHHSASPHTMARFACRASCSLACACRPCNFFGCSEMVVCSSCLAGSAVMLMHKNEGLKAPSQTHLALSWRLSLCGCFGICSGACHLLQDQLSCSGLWRNARSISIAVHRRLNETHLLLLVKDYALVDILGRAISCRTPVQG